MGRWPPEVRLVRMWVAVSPHHAGRHTARVARLLASPVSVRAALKRGPCPCLALLPQVRHELLLVLLLAGPFGALDFQRPRGPALQLLALHA